MTILIILPEIPFFFKIHLTILIAILIFNIAKPIVEVKKWRVTNHRRGR